MATRSEIDALIRWKSDATEVFAVFKKIADEYKKLKELSDKLKTGGGSGGGGSSPSGSPKTPANQNAQADAINRVVKALKDEQAALAANRAETERVGGTNARVNASYVRREVELKNLIRQAEALSRADAKGVVDQDRLRASIDRLSDRARASAAGFNAQEAAMRRAGQTSITIQSSFNKLGSTINSVGQTAQSLGTKLSVALTVPLTAGAYKIGQYGLTVDQLKNQLIAFEGSSLKAENRLASLRKLVDDNAGATREMAYEVYGLLKPLETVSDNTINRTITSLGRLKLGFKDLIPRDFAYNLSQIFGQGFEESDIKQAIGQVPKFRQYLVKAFGTDDKEVLKEMKASGKLTMDSFFQGFSEAVEKDSVLAGLQEPVALRMQKFVERTFEALEPIANRIVDIIAKIIEFASPYLAQFAKWFQSISPFFQNVIIALGVIAAALGPVLIALGAVIGFLAPLVSGIGSLIGAIVSAGSIVAFLSGLLATVGTVITVVLIPALKIIIPVVVLVTAAILGLIAAGAALYLAWQSDFGGFKTFTLQTWEAIKVAFKAAYDFIYALVVQVGGAIIGWWRENYPIIKETVISVSDAIKSYIQSFLNAVNAFWQSHGKNILDYVTTYWNVIKGIISTVMAQIGGYIRLALQLIQGNWSGAWKTFLGILKNATATLIQIWTGALNLFWRAMRAFVPILIDWLKLLWGTIVPWVLKIIAYVVYLIATLPYQLLKLVPTLVKAGIGIGKAIWDGIKEGLGLAAKQNPIQLDGVPTNYPDPNKIDPNQVTNDDLSGGFTFSEKQTTVSGGGASTKKTKDEAEKRQKELEEIRKRDIAAQIQSLQNRLEKAEKLYDETIAKRREKLEKDGDTKTFLEKANEALEIFRGEVRETTALLENLENQQDKADNKIASEIKNRQEEQEKRRVAQGDKITKSVEDNNKAIEEADKKRKEAEKKKTEEQKKREDDIFEVDNMFYERRLQNDEDESAARIKLWEKEAETYKRTWTEVQSQIEVEQEATFRKRLQTQAENLQYEIEAARKRGETVDVSQTQYINENNEVVNYSGGENRPPNAGALVTSTSSKEVAQAQIEYDKGLRALQEFLANRGKRLDDAAEKDKARQRELAKNVVDLQEQVASVQMEATERRIEQLRAEEEEEGFFFRKKRELNALEIQLEIDKENQRSRMHLAELQRKKDEIEADKNRYAELVLINQLIEAENQRHKQAMGGLEQKKAENEGNAPQTNTPGGFFGTINSALKATGAWKKIGAQLKSTFDSVANAVGNAVKAFVLFGSAGGGFKKFAAELIASLAQMSAVQAVWELALGFAALARAFFGDPKAAAEAKMHFISSAIFGAIAGVAAIAGRAVAGDSFKNEQGGGSGGGSVDGTVSNAPSSQAEGETVKFNERLGELIEILKNRDNKLELIIRTDEMQIIDIAARANRRNTGRQRLQNITGVYSYNLDG